VGKVYQAKWISHLGIIGINLFGRWILVVDKGDEVLVNHEQIHSKQWRELGVLVFMWQYISSYFINLFKYGAHRKAYLNIPLEIEAYDNQNDFSYLKKGKNNG
jgi:hypothetical protein